MKKKFTYFTSLTAIALMLSACNNLNKKCEQTQCPAEIQQQTISFNTGWQFIKLSKDDEKKLYSAKDVDSSKWENVTVPHTANMEPYITIPETQWQGICWYRKNFNVDFNNDKEYIIEFEAMMNKANIWINGEFVSMYQGGYLPVVIDATKYLKNGDNVIAIQLDNYDNAVTGPKPIKILDFQMYSGIYRDCWLTTKNKIHITNSILADKVASGGIYVTYPEVSDDEATVKVKTHIANKSSNNATVKVIQNLYDAGKLVNSSSSKEFLIDANSDKENIIEFEVDDPKLWSPDSPNLYELVTIVQKDNQVIDCQKTTIGIRNFEFRADKKFYINGKKTFLRGVNRHQDYPYVGNAISNNAQFRDAAFIKDAGFNMVRIAHYPQATSFLKACDKLGIVVMEPILGWQFFKETAEFRNQSYESLRDLIRRDRNHPSIFTWETSLNETQMPEDYMATLHKIAKEESPEIKTCGWNSKPYDIYIQARQHRINHPQEMSDAKPYFVSEYGDWEYFSNNFAFNTKKLNKADRLKESSRKHRWEGEVPMLQQVFNVQEAHNANLATYAFGDAYWDMCDYNAGKNPEFSHCGIMNILRIPKLAYYFYQSQRDFENGGVVEIASYWDENSTLDVIVLSNCDEIALYLNDELITKQKPDSDENSKYIKHPIFTFKLDKFVKGTLKAEGYKDGKVVAIDHVTTPGKPVDFKISINDAQRPASTNDVVFVNIEAVDENGTLCHTFTDKVEVEVEGAKLLNTDGVNTEAGIATALIAIPAEVYEVRINAKSKDIKKTFSFFPVKE